MSGDVQSRWVVCVCVWEGNGNGGEYFSFFFIIPQSDPNVMGSIAFEGKKKKRKKKGQKWIIFW